MLSGPNSFEALGLSVKYLGGDGVGVLSPVSLVLGRCPGRAAGEMTREVLLHRLPLSKEPTESNDDAEDMDDDLENANGEDVVDESESFMVSGLDVIEQDKEERLLNIVHRTADDGGRAFSPLDFTGHFLDKKAISSVVHLCN